MDDTWLFDTKILFLLRFFLKKQTIGIGSFDKELQKNEYKKP